MTSAWSSADCSWNTVPGRVLFINSKIVVLKKLHKWSRIYNADAKSDSIFTRGPWVQIEFYLRHYTVNAILLISLLILLFHSLIDSLQQSHCTKELLTRHVGQDEEGLRFLTVSYYMSKWSSKKIDVLKIDTTLLNESIFIPNGVFCKLF